MFHEAYQWYFQLPIHKAKEVKKAVMILTRAGMAPSDALVAIYSAPRNQFPAAVPTRAMRG